MVWNLGNGLVDHKRFQYYCMIVQSVCLEVHKAVYQSPTLYGIENLPCQVALADLVLRQDHDNPLLYLDGDRHICSSK